VSDDNKAPERVAFTADMASASWQLTEHGVADCLLNAISDTDAILTVEDPFKASISRVLPAAIVDRSGLSAMRTCPRQRTEIDVQF